jgi:membrane protein implicated in regulation of membrane protease activity
VGDGDGRVARLLELLIALHLPIMAMVMVALILTIGPFPLSLLLAAPLALLAVLVFRKNRRSQRRHG